MGLKPWKGKVICVVVKDIETQKCTTFSGSDENKLLKEFWDSIEGCWFITYNGDEFDIPFLIKRSLIQNIKMKKIYCSIDMRKVVNGFWFSYKRDIKGKLSDWARVLHMPVKTNLGKEIFKLYRKNDFKAIRNHCKEDVELTYSLFLRCLDSNLIKQFN